MENRGIVGATAIGVGGESGAGGGFDGLWEETEVERIAGVALDRDHVSEAGEEHKKAKGDEAHENVAEEDGGGGLQCGNLHRSISAPAKGLLSF